MPFKSLGHRITFFVPGSRMRKFKIIHVPAERGSIATLWIDDDDSGCRFSMLVDEAGQHSRVVRLVKQITADNQIKLGNANGRIPPGAPEKGYRAAVIQAGIVLQENLGLRVIIAGGNVRETLIQHVAGQSYTTANFKDSQAADIVVLHRTGQYFTRGVQHTKHGPGRGGDPKLLSQTRWIIKLLVVPQRSQMNVGITEFKRMKAITELCHYEAFAGRERVSGWVCPTQ